MRRSRHIVPQNNTPPIPKVRRIEPRDIFTVNVFDEHRLLPFNWLHALVNLIHPSGYSGLRDRCTNLCEYTKEPEIRRKDNWYDHLRLLGRFTFAYKNNYETMTYFRTEDGTDFLRSKGYDPLPNDTTLDAHQILVDLVLASIKIGASGTDVEYGGWRYIKDHDETPTLPDNPFRYDLGNKISLTPDGRPFQLKKDGKSYLFLMEIERTDKGKQKIKNKLKKYKQAHELIRRRYGRSGIRVLWYCTSEEKRHNTVKWIEEVFGGPCNWICVGTITDHTINPRSKPEVTTKHFTEPYLRAGFPPFSLEQLGDYVPPKPRTPIQNEITRKHDNFCTCTGCHNNREINRIKDLRASP